MANKDTGVVNIHGKEYKTVANRVAEFREQHPDWTILTELVAADDTTVIMRASILDGDKVIATGYAEEVRGSSNINKTSAVENCETSCVGRALAFFGLGGTEIASADEVANAINQQKNIEMIEYNNLVKKHIHSIAAIKESILHEAWSSAVEAWHEIPDEDKKGLWKAPTLGGIFTTQEREAMSLRPEQLSVEDFKNLANELNCKAGNIR